jgi:hypothetical protein
MALGDVIESSCVAWPGAFAGVSKQPGGGRIDLPQPDARPGRGRHRRKPRRRTVRPAAGGSPSWQMKR